MSLRCWKYLYLVWNLFFFFSSSFYGGKFIFWFICMHSKVLILNDLCFSCLQKSVPCHKSIEILFCIFLLKVLKFCLSHYTCNWFFFMVWGGGLFSFFSLGTHHMFADLLGNSLMLEKPSQGRLGHRAPAVSYGRRGICHPFYLQTHPDTKLSHSVASYYSIEPIHWKLPIYFFCGFYTTCG